MIREWGGEGGGEIPPLAFYTDDLFALVRHGQAEQRHIVRVACARIR